MTHKMDGMYCKEAPQHQQESQGMCRRVPQQINKPFGPDAATSILCKPFRQDGQKSIAVVGNGPLSAQDRAEIEFHSLIVRLSLILSSLVGIEPYLCDYYLMFI